MIERRYIGPFTLKEQTVTDANTSSTLLSLETAAPSEGELLYITNPAYTATPSNTARPYITLVYHRDHLGSVREMTTIDGTLLEQNDYYPFGLRTTRKQTYITLSQSLASATAPRYLYNGKEKQDFIHNTNALINVGGSSTYTSNYLDYGARFYNPITLRWTTQDPMAEKYMGYSPYNYCVNSPISFVDPNGMDTLNISYQDGKWIFDTPILAKGDDVFNVSKGDYKRTVTFSEGEYGLRVLALNLEITDNYTLGIYHISGTTEGGTGYFVTPGGEISEQKGDNKRIAEGEYPMTTPSKDRAKWRTVGLGGNIERRGIKFHYGKGNIVTGGWTQGCFVISSAYEQSKNGKDIKYILSESEENYKNFNKLLGATGFFKYNPTPNSNERTGAEYKNKIKHKFILK